MLEQLEELVEECSTTRRKTACKSAVWISATKNEKGGSKRFLRVAVEKRNKMM